MGPWECIYYLQICIPTSGTKLLDPAGGVSSPEPPVPILPSTFTPLTNDFVADRTQLSLINALYNTFATQNRLLLRDCASIAYRSSLFRLFLFSTTIIVSHHQRCHDNVVAAAGVDVAVFCNGTWDTVLCWPATPAGTVVNMPCPDFPRATDPTSTYNCYSVSTNKVSIVNH